MALLLAAVLGILLVVIPGAGRMIQLRRTARRHRQADAAATLASASPDGPDRPAPAAPGPDSADVAGGPPDGIIRT